jgi:hypothetical protein
MWPNGRSPCGPVMGCHVAAGKRAMRAKIEKIKKQLVGLVGANPESTTLITNHTISYWKNSSYISSKSIFVTKISEGTFHSSK